MIGRSWEARERSPATQARRLSAWPSKVWTGASWKQLESQSYVYILACGKAAGSMSPSEIQFTAPPPLFLYSHVRGDPVSKPWMAMMLHS